MTGSANCIAASILGSLFLGVGAASLSFAEIDRTDRAGADFGSVAKAPGSSDSALAISGVPPASVQAYSFYDFRPTAKNAENDPLVFKIANKPSWAGFDELTGNLLGIPTQEHAGYYPGIEISVSNGKLAVTTPAFDIEVVPQYAQLPATGSIVLGWSAPLENEDGTTLVDLAGYRIYYGRQPQSLQMIVELPHPGLNQYQVDQLPLGIGYFAMTALNSQGVESALSRILTQKVR